MKIKYNFIVSFLLFLFISFSFSVPVFASTVDDPFATSYNLPLIAKKMYEHKWNVPLKKNVLILAYSQNVIDKNNCTETWGYDGHATEIINYSIVTSDSPIAIKSGSDGTLVTSNTSLLDYCDMSISERCGLCAGCDRDILNGDYVAGFHLGTYSKPILSSTAVMNSMLLQYYGAKDYNVFSQGSVSYNGIAQSNNIDFNENVDFDKTDLSKYPVGTVKIVQPESGAMFSSGVTTSIDFEVWGKIPININDSKFSGLSENLWLSNALSAPITASSTIYIDGVPDRVGTGIGINSASLGDSYGLKILGDVDQWKKTGYYCFKYKFAYSPQLSKTVDSVKFGVSPITSWTSGYLFGDDYLYTYYSDSLDIKVDTFVDYNNDGIDDVTGEDLSNLDDNTSHIGLDKNASLSDTFEYYSNKIYDTLTGIIKTPFSMLEKALVLGNTYLTKMTDILGPVSDNFKQLLTFVPDDIMTCIWGVIVCRLTWTTIRSFISMVTKR